MDARQAAATGRVLAAAVRSEWRAGLLVMADLSARRTAKAPAAFHPAAEEFDRRIADIVRKGEIARLLEVDAELAAELRTGGMAALWLLAGALAGAGPLRGEVLDERAPFGVGYLAGILESG
jgi:aromatic ring-opening dioxygenase LigB subunit